MSMNKLWNQTAGRSDVLKLRLSCSAKALWMSDIEKEVTPVLQ
jgi:hypothetical protein